jgi:hypothetical protein
VSGYSDEQVAQVVHESIRGLQYILEEDCPSDPWPALSPEAREPVIAAVALARSGASPQQMHAVWVRTRRLEGWIPGAVKDPGLRTHPALVPWEELSPGQQDKDRLFLAVVNALSPSAVPAIW